MCFLGKTCEISYRDNHTKKGCQSAAFRFSLILNELLLSFS